MTKQPTWGQAIYLKGLEQIGNRSYDPSCHICRELVSLGFAVLTGNLDYIEITEQGRRAWRRAAQAATAMPRV